MKTYDLIIKNAHGLRRENGTLKTFEQDIAIKDGLIAGFGSYQDTQAEKTIDVSGLICLPGLMDTQVHMREPGLEHKEDLRHGTMAAVAGGITSVFEMPNTKPSTTDEAQLQKKLQIAQKNGWCDFAFYMGASPENASQLGDLEQLPGCCGIKIFMGSSTGSLLVDQEDTLEQIIKNGSRRIAVHCEDEDRLKERKKIVSKPHANVKLHPDWRDEQSALMATQKVVQLAQKHHRPIHVLHVTTKQEMNFLKEYKQKLISVECTPQHLTLSAPECYEKLGTYAQMNPPIRGMEHLKALWQGIENHTVDIIGSDHAPHTREEKELPYPQSPSGMPGVQTIVLIMLDHVRQGRLSLNRLVELMNINPIERFKIKNKGTLELGKDADITIVDLKKEFTITDAWIKSKCGWTPFNGKKVRAMIHSTIIRGQVALLEGELQQKPEARQLQFELK